MPNVNRIPFIVENGKVKWDNPSILIGGFPGKMREIAEEEILDKVKGYQGETNKYPIGEVKVVNKEYYEIIWNEPSKLPDHVKP